MNRALNPIHFMMQIESDLKVDCMGETENRTTILKTVACLLRVLACSQLKQNTKNTTEWNAINCHTAFVY